ncbi:MAG: molybdopterin-binding protein [Anaerolineae bacterium]|nr:molybdopterin-binding protein [Anaerolineae bacterium]
MPELLDLCPPDEAWRIFREHFDPQVAAERLPVREALGRVLAEDLSAPHDLPTFPRCAMDGYAVRAADTYGASPGLPAYLDVVGEVLMGEAPTLEIGLGQCALVHTGCMLPSGADAVVMVEVTQPVDERSIEVLKPVAEGENVIQVGEDVRRGDAVLPAGHRLRPQDLGGLLALGITAVSVARRPRVAILSQGDELVEPEQEPRPGQVRDINSATLAALVEQAGGIPLRRGIVGDDLEALRQAAEAALTQADVLVMSAGSSVSARDMTAQVINGLGQPGVLVHGVSVRPGKPTILAVCDGKPVFGLPGNPVSAVNAFRLFVTPAIHLLQGGQPSPPRAVPARLARNVASATGRQDHVPVRLEERDGETWAVPIFGKSNLIYTLIRADGELIVPLDSGGMAEGEMVTVFLY